MSALRVALVVGKGEAEKVNEVGKDEPEEEISQVVR
jgi:hypothetical protein